MSVATSATLLHQMALPLSLLSLLPSWSTSSAQ
jgi:hypothetical protein